MTLYDIKPKFQNLLRPSLNLLYRLGVTANQVTLLGLILSLVVGGILIISPDARLFWLLPLFLFFRMALNAIDGMLAREYNQKSRLGAVLNETSDVISDAVLYLPFALLAHAVPELVIATVILSILTEFCGVVAQTIGSARNYAGPLGKSDRALVFGAYGLCISLWPQTMLYSVWIFSIVVLLLVYTCINRCRLALKPE